MNILIHRGFDARVAKQLLQYLWLHTAFNRSRSIDVAECVHTESFDSGLITQFIQVGIVETVLHRFLCSPVKKDEILHDKVCLLARSVINVL